MVTGTETPEGTILMQARIIHDLRTENASLKTMVENSNSADGQAEKVNLPSTGMQQLKAEIADIVITLSRHKYSEFTKKTYNVLLKRMRQLSAV